MFLELFRGRIKSQKYLNWTKKEKSSVIYISCVGILPSKSNWSIVQENKSTVLSSTVES